MAVQLQGQTNSTTKPEKKGGKVQDISSFKKKPDPFNYDPIGNAVFSAAVKVALNDALIGAWTPNHHKIGEVPANEPLLTIVKPKESAEVVDNKVDSPPWEPVLMPEPPTITERARTNNGKLVQDAAVLKPQTALKDDSSKMCQELHNGLRMWLEAYCPIPNNVCILSDRDKHIARTEASRKKRESLGLPPYEDNNYTFKKEVRYDRATGRRYEVVNKVYKMTWDTRTRNQSVLHPIKGWHGYRSPTLVELLVQAYKDGYTMEKAASKTRKKSEHVAGFFKTLTSKIKATKYDELFLSGQQEEAANDGHQVIEDHYTMTDREVALSWLQSKGIPEDSPVQQKLWEMGIVPFINDTPIHLTNIVRAMKVYQLSECRRYYHWLYSHEPFNPHIDYVPFCHRHVDSEHGVSFLYGDRYEGRKAAEFAPASRGNKNTSWFLDCKWNRYLCYYNSFKKGHISEDQLIEIGKYIYGDIESCSALASSTIWNSNREGDTSKKEMLMLPAPANVSRMPKQSAKVDEVKSVASILESHTQHPSGLAPEEVSHLLIRKAWKNLGSILVPEDYNPEVNKCIITDIQNYKVERHAKSA